MLKARIKLTNRAFSKHVIASGGMEVDDIWGEEVAFAMASGILYRLHQKVAAAVTEVRLKRKII